MILFADSRFRTKCELDPFAISKFLGHNAIHALLGYLAKEEGIAYMHEAGKRQDLMEKVCVHSLKRQGWVVSKYSHVEDPLFTEVVFVIMWMMPYSDG